MKIPMKKIALTLLGSLLLLIPLLAGYAQRKTNMKKDDVSKQSRQVKARTALSSSVAGNLLLDAVTTERSEWLLDEANYLPRLNDKRPANTNMSLISNGQKVIVSIVEFDTTETAAKVYRLPRSAGTSQTAEKLGDEGEKIFGQNGEFGSLRYRQGNIITTILTPDEKIADQFAQLAAQAFLPIALKDVK